MDIEGYIVEKLSGQSLPDFMRDHIYKPLGMRDAGFFVPADKRSRFATLYVNDDQGKMKPEDGKGFGGTYSEQPTMPSGGGGMVSTAEDYYRFAQMLANGGELDGKRILAPASVKLMTSNHLAPNLLTGEYGIGMQQMRPGFGYGYNCAVVLIRPTANLPDGKGTFFWDGAAGTWFWVDPTNDVVFVGMIQRQLGRGSPNVELQYEPRAGLPGAGRPGEVRKTGFRLEHAAARAYFNRSRAIAVMAVTPVLDGWLIHRRKQRRMQSGQRDSCFLGAREFRRIGRTHPEHDCGDLAVERQQAHVF